MNKKLPADVAFHEVIPVSDSAHVCLDATSRTYDYFFHSFPDALLNRTSSFLDLEGFKPNVVAEFIPNVVKTTDFSEFCLTPKRHHSTIVSISNVAIYQNPAGNRFRMRFVANRFLRGMIRILVHDLLRAGKGELSQQAFYSMLKGASRERKVDLAPPQGLFLTGVNYPYIAREPELPFCGSCDWIPISPS